MFDCGKIRSDSRKQILALVVATLALAGILVLIRTGVQERGAFAVVFVDGSEQGRFSLAEDGTHRIDTGEDSYNILRVHSGAASVTEANCPNQVCVHTKAARFAGETITCLPHRLQIRIEGGAPSQYDAISD